MSGDTFGNNLKNTAGSMPGVMTADEVSAREPHLYAVILHNDDYTTMDFVVAVLIRVFQKTPQEAEAIMMNVHSGGEGVAGIYPFDVAMTKKLLAERMAEERNYPLKVTVSAAAEGLS